MQGSQAAQWVSRRLARNQRVLVASAAYLAQHGVPSRLGDLLAHSCLVVRENGNAQGQRFDTWTSHPANGTRPEQVRVHGPLSSNSGELVRDWCLQGRGIMLRSLWDVAPELTAGKLERVLPGYAMLQADIHWLAPCCPDLPRRIRLLIDFLVAEFEDPPWKASQLSALPAGRPD